MINSIYALKYAVHIFSKGSYAMIVELTDAYIINKIVQKDKGEWKDNVKGWPVIILRPLARVG